MEALSFLQNYDLKYVGGIERILQTSSELSQRREKETINSAYSTVSLANRFRANIWKGFSPQKSSPSEAVPQIPSTIDDHTDGDDREISRTAYQPTFASQITTSLWRGITNQTAMEGSPSPPSSPPSSPGPTVGVVMNQDRNKQAASSIWGYAERLKGSDAVVTFSKVSSGWRAKGLLTSWGMNSGSPPGSPELKSNSTPVNFESIPRRDLPPTSPPRIFSPPLVQLADPSLQKLQEVEAPSNTGLMEKTKSLMSMVSPPAPAPRSAPKPLLLNSSSSIVSGSKVSNRHPRSSSAGYMSTPETDEWADVMRLKRQHFHRDSQSSISSLSPSDAFGRGLKSGKSDRESDTGGSRVVALNRRSISPMAPNFRAQSRPSSRNSSTSSDIHSPPLHSKSPLQRSSSWKNLPPMSALGPHGSPGQIISSPVAITTSPMGFFSVKESNKAEITSNELPSPSRKPSRKKSIPSPESEDTPNSAPIVTLGRSPRLRSKRHPRPADLQIHDGQRSRVSAEQKSPNSSNLTVEWPVDDQDNIATPKASSFDSDDCISRSPATTKSPQRSRKISSPSDKGRLRKNSLEFEDEKRTRKSSTGHRKRKISTESRVVPRVRRESAAEEGDDEGYDELLSAYDSEGGPDESLSLR